MLLNNNKFKICMKIQSVCLENIKKFGSKGVVFNFSRYHDICTISGKNGSGKTALLKAIQLFQKLFFFNQLANDFLESYDLLKSSLKEEVVSLLSAKKGLIDIIFQDDERKYHIKLEMEVDGEYLNYNFKDGLGGSISGLCNYWNFSDPKCIVAFVDAGKSFSEFSVSLAKISLLSRQQKKQDFIFECIFDPEKTLQAIYKKTVLDHIQYRLDPNRKYDYFRFANKAIKKIAPNIEVKSISATKVDGHLVMLGKTSEDVQYFDVKDFSAGERALYLTLLFIFYLPNVGVLIIDEPENHLHESLLRNFYNFLRELVRAGGASAWLNAQSDLEGDNSASSSENENLTQIFLTTHSKALIYQNLSEGECLVITENGVLPIEDGTVEAELRSAGISTVFSRTLFVEGSSDTSLLSGMLEKSGVKVVVADSCKEVIDYFKKISKIRNKMHGAAFCFAIDNDNRTKEDIAEIEKFDAEFFEKSFVVLERHEMENFLIDKELISDALNPALEKLSKKKINNSLLSGIFKNEAEALKRQSKAKYISSGLKIFLKNLIVDPIVDTKSLVSEGADHVVSKVMVPDLTSKIKVEAESLSADFDARWEESWVNLVDGKAFLGRTLSKLSKECAGIDVPTIRENIILQLQRNPDRYEAGSLLKEVDKKLNSQYAF